MEHSVPFNFKHENINPSRHTLWLSSQTECLHKGKISGKKTYQEDILKAWGKRRTVKCNQQCLFIKREHGCIVFDVCQASFETFIVS